MHSWSSLEHILRIPVKTKIWPVCTEHRTKRVQFYTARTCKIYSKKWLSVARLSGYLNWQTDNGKVYPRTGHKGPEGEYRYSFTLSLTSALDGGGWSLPHPSHFAPRKETQYPLYMRLCGPQGQSGCVRKISSPPGFNPCTIHPIQSNYTWGYKIQYDTH
jgi:hypothetical protein